MRETANRREKNQPTHRFALLRGLFYRVKDGMPAFPCDFENAARAHHVRHRLRAMITAERGGEIAVRKFARECGRQKRAQVLGRFDYARREDLDETMVMPVPIARETRALGGFFARAAHAPDFLLVNQQDFERKIRVREQFRNVHQFVKNIFKDAALGRTASAQFRFPVRRHAHEPLFLRNRMHEA
jgi:hypothetical protein